MARAAARRRRSASQSGPPISRRIAQECLNNVVKHSKAGKVFVSFKKAGALGVLSVKDDGAGFDLDDKPSGLGLRGIRERAAIISGTIGITSSPGNGTAVVLSVPIEENSDEE